jgi:hypothetical protein
MTDHIPDTRLVILLRAAMPPAGAAGPSRDMWPLVVKRSRKRQKWSWVDLALAAGAAAALVIRSEVIVLLTYYF